MMVFFSITCMSQTIKLLTQNDGSNEFRAQKAENERRYMDILEQNTSRKNILVPIENSSKIKENISNICVVRPSVLENSLERFENRVKMIQNRSKIENRSKILPMPIPKEEKKKVRKSAKKANTVPGNSSISVLRSSRQSTDYVDFFDLLSVPSHWSRKHDKYEVHEEEISGKSLEDLNVRFILLASFSCGNVKKITRVQNPFLYHRYQLRKEEYKARGIPFREQTLFHDTSKSNVSSILKNNLDWRLVKRSRFGKGVSFSPDTEYANNKSSKKNGSNRAMIIAKVLVGSSHSGYYSCKLPRDGYDTTIDSNRKKVYVKYYDDEFYPEYVAYYN